MTEQNSQVRIRVNVGRTSKGAPSYDCTVEVVTPLQEPTHEKWNEQITAISNFTLAESERVEAVLKAKYGSEWE
jgi:hypothetical protein|tara:strand:- start:313 stop:534 length:222 start_codon:yes stop_codon:yes gene_type:complete